MDVSKVKAALTSARTELANSVTAARKVLSDPKASIPDVNNAAKVLNVAGRIDSALTKADSKIDGALKRLNGRPKKEKAPKPAKAAK